MIVMMGAKGLETNLMSYQLRGEVERDNGIGPHSKEQPEKMAWLGRK